MTRPTSASPFTTLAAMLALAALAQLAVHGSARASASAPKLRNESVILVGQRPEPKPAAVLCDKAATSAQRQAPAHPLAGSQPAPKLCAEQKPSVSGSASAEP